MQRYASYKDSGVEWLGEIPTHWEIKRNIGVFDERKESKQADMELLSVTINRGIIKQDEITAKKDSSNEDKSKYKVVRKLDLAYNKMRMWQGAIGVSEYDGIVSPAYIVLRPRDTLYSRYFHYLYRTDAFIAEANRNSYGLCMDMNSLRYEDFKTIYSPVPPRADVERIVNFLDLKTAEIDTAIAKKKRLIELLQEQKRIIFDLILYGLSSSDGSSPVITGNQFIPLVGAEVRLVQLGRLCNKIADGPHFSPSYVEPHEGYLFLSAGNIRPNEFLLEDVKYVSERLFNEFSKLVRPEIGDVLYTKGGTTGVAKVVDLDLPFQVWVHIAVLKLRKDIVDPFYLAYVLNSTKCYEQSQLFTRGATNKDLGLTRMKNIYLPFISIEKQRVLVTQLDKLNFNYRKTESTIFREIELLQQLKTCLICESVSGKIKV